jgi:hypothetical protein
MSTKTKLSPINDGPNFRMPSIKVFLEPEFSTTCFMTPDEYIEWKIKYRINITGSNLKNTLNSA